VKRFILALVVALFVLPTSIAQAQAEGDPDLSNPIDDDFNDGAGQPGPVDPSVLWLGHGRVEGVVDMTPQTRAGSMGNPNGDCFDEIVDVISIDPDGNVTFIPELIPCAYVVTCHQHRVDDDEATAATDPIVAEWNLLFTKAWNNAASAGLPNGWDIGLPFEWRFTEPDVESVVVLDYCVEGNSNAILDNAVQPWGLQYQPSWFYVPLVDEIIDPVSEAQELWQALEAPDIKIASTPTLDAQAVVQGPLWVWLDDLEEPWAVSVSPAQTAALAVRARAVNTVWEFGDPEEDSEVECALDELVQYNELIHDWLDPADAGACSYRYIHTCYPTPANPRYPNSQCGDDPGFDITVTITFEGEQAFFTRASVSEPWPTPIWEPFSGTRQVTSEVLEMPVIEILSANG